jgi:hypothetical protein
MESDTRFILQHLEFKIAKQYKTSQLHNQVRENACTLCPTPFCYRTNNASSLVTYRSNFKSPFVRTLMEEKGNTIGSPERLADVRDNAW